MSDRSDTIRSRNQKLALMYAIAAVICWSLGAYLCCLISTMPILQVLAIGQIGGAITYMAFEGKWPQWKDFTHCAARRWPFALLLLTNQISYIYAFRSAPAAHVDLINYTWPVILVVCDSVRTGSRLSTMQILGMVVCFVGLLVLFSPELLSQSAHPREHFAGYIAAVTAAASWTSYQLFGRCKRSEGSDTACSTSIEMLMGGVAVAIFHSATDTWVMPAFSQGMIVITYAVLCFGLSYPTWRRSVMLGSCSYTAGFANAIPVLSIAWLVVGGVVAMSHSLWQATLLVTIGCAILSRAQSVPAKPAKALKAQLASS